MGDSSHSGQTGAIYVVFLTTEGSILSFQKIDNSYGRFPYTVTHNGFFGANCDNIGDVNYDGIR